MEIPELVWANISGHFISGCMRNCNEEPGFLDFLRGHLVWQKSKKIAQKGIFNILRNAVFLEDEKKSAPDLYRRDDRHGKRLRNGQFDGF